MGDAAHSLGALSDKERHLTKLSLAIGARLEGATKAHVRRALEAGLSADEIKQVVALAVTTLGFPAAVSAYTWVNDVLDEQ